MTIRGWKDSRLRDTPRPLEAREQFLKRHAVESHVMRAHPDIDRPSIRGQSHDDGEKAKAKGAPSVKTRRTEAGGRIGQVDVFKRQATGRQHTTGVGTVDRLPDGTRAVDF